MKYKCYCVICKKLIGKYFLSCKRKTCSKQCKTKLQSKNSKGKNNSNFKHGKCYFPNYCLDCNKKIDKCGRSKRCPKCHMSKYNPFKGKHHTKKSKRIIGKKSKAKFTKKYIEKNYRQKFKGNKKRSINGYTLIKSYSHPDRNSNNDMLEHRLVMEKIIGRRLTKKEIVHHINFIKDDNRAKNLYLYINRSKHLEDTKSIYKLISELLKLEIIKFEKGKYKMNRRKLVVMGGKL